MEVDFQHRLPDPRLRPYVDAYFGYREAVEGHLVRNEFGGSRSVLILGWGSSVTVRDPRGGAAWHGPSLVAGPYDSYVVSDSHGVAEAVQLMLSPLGARLLHGIPLAELANRTVGVDELDDGWLAALVPRLAEAASWHRRFAILDTALLRRFTAAPSPDPALRWAWRRLTDTGGQVRIGELCAELELSRGSLARRFRRELGLGPKTMARLLRFDAAYARRERAAATGWAGIAAECGYFDQAHLNADFRQFTGATPTAVAGSPVMSTDD